MPSSLSTEFKFGVSVSFVVHYLAYDEGREEPDRGSSHQPDRGSSHQHTTQVLLFLEHVIFIAFFGVCLTLF